MRGEKSILCDSVPLSQISFFPELGLALVGVAFEQEPLELVDAGKHLVSAGQHPPADLLGRERGHQIHRDAFAVGHRQLGRCPAALAYGVVPIADYVVSLVLDQVEVKLDDLAHDAAELLRQAQAHHRQRELLDHRAARGGDDDFTQDDTLFSITAIRALLTTEPLPEDLAAVLGDEEKASILKGLSELEAQGIHNIPLRLNQSILDAVRAANRRRER